MHIHIIYAHPSTESFTARILEAFKRGMRSAGHGFTINDLYKTDSPSCLDPIQYQREMSYNPVSTLPEDVLHEQENIQKADALAFVYPVWWSDCPAILKGWFDRIWTNGFAYAYNDNTRTSHINPKQALVICTAGHTLAHLEATGIAQSMRCIMVNDRLLNTGFTRCEMVILGGTTTGDTKVLGTHLDTAFSLGATWFVGS